MDLGGLDVHVWEEVVEVNDSIIYLLLQWKLFNMASISHWLRSKVSSLFPIHSTIRLNTYYYRAHKDDCFIYFSVCFNGKWKEQAARGVGRWGNRGINYKLIRGSFCRRLYHLIEGKIMITIPATSN